MKLGSRKPLVVATAAATGVLAVAVGVAVAASASASSATPSPSPSGRPSGAPFGPGHPGGPGRGFGGPGGPGGFGGRGEVLHSEEVVQRGTTYVTIDEQSGKVTAVTPTSITVKSSDGYIATYVVGSATRIGKKGDAAKISEVAVGDTVRIEGTKSGGTGGTAGTVTADRVMDGLPPAGAWRGPGNGPGPGNGAGNGPGPRNGYGPGGTARPSPPAAPSSTA